MPEGSGVLPVTRRSPVAAMSHAELAWWDENAGINERWPCFYSDGSALRVQASTKSQSARHLPPAAFSNSSCLTAISQSWEKEARAVRLRQDTARSIERCNAHAMVLDAMLGLLPPLRGGSSPSIASKTIAMFRAASEKCPECLGL